MAMTTGNIIFTIKFNFLLVIQLAIAIAANHDTRVILEIANQLLKFSFDRYLGMHHSNINAIIPNIIPQVSNQ